MSNLASCLRGARAFLQMNTKSVARALRVSDRVVTKLELDANEDDPHAAQLIMFYEDLGVRFLKECETIRSIAPNNVKKLVLSASGHANPDESINKLLTYLRHIGGLVYNQKTLDKTKASRYDTIEVHIPVPVRVLVREILRVWCQTEPALEIHFSDGSVTNLTEANVDNLL